MHNRSFWTKIKDMNGGKRKEITAVREKSINRVIVKSIEEEAHTTNPQRLTE